MKILQMSSELDGGGVERILYDYYRYMDHNSVQFDFVKVESPEGILEQPLREMGCKIFTLPPMKADYKRYCNTLEEILRNGNYDAIHCNGGYRSAVALKIAKKCGVNVRIAHAHSANYNETAKQKIARLIATQMAKHYATTLFACGEKAGEWMWGARALRDKKFTLVHNAVETSHFLYDESKRRRMREQLDVTDKFVLGNVGRLSRQKNHKFMLNMFGEVVKLCPNAVLLLIGRGELEEEVRAQIAALGLTNHVKLLGVRDDVPDLLNAMDLFILPSLYEGLPVTMIEVQANGLPMLIADTITRESAITPNVQYLPLDRQAWVSAITSGKFSRIPDGASKVQQAGYDIQVEASRLTTQYKMLYDVVV